MNVSRFLDHSITRKIGRTIVLMRGWVARFLSVSRRLSPLNLPIKFDLSLDTPADPFLRHCHCYLLMVGKVTRFSNPAEYGTWQ